MRLHDIQDKIKELGNLELYSGKLRPYLPNPYNLESNNNISLLNGWGILTGSGDDTGEFYGSSPVRRYSRVLTLVFTIQNIGNTQTDAMVYSNDQTLTGDAFQLLESLRNNSDLRRLVTSFEYSSDDGIVLFGGENDKEYMQFSLNINVTYTENVSVVC